MEQPKLTIVENAPVSSMDYDAADPSVAPHPEATTASIDIRLGSSFFVRARLRTTPASVVSVAILAAVLLFGTRSVVSALRAR